MPHRRYHLRRRTLAVAVCAAIVGALLVAAGAPPSASAAGVGTLSGVVTDASGTPLASVGISVYTDSTSDLAAIASTGVDGTWTTPVPADAYYEIQFLAPFPGYYATEWFEGSYSRAGGTAVQVLEGIDTPDISAQLELTSTVAGILEGTVTDGLGAPVEGATVVARTNPASGIDRTTTTGADGHYALHGMAPGDYVVFVNPPDPYAAEYHPGGVDLDFAELVTVAPLTRREVDVTVALGGSIGGIITSNGAGIDGAEVVVIGGVGDDFGKRTTTNAAGGYQVGGLHPGEYTVCFQPPDGYNAIPECFDDAQGNEPTTPVPVEAGSLSNGIDADLAVGARISGEVTSPSGPGVEGATVWALDSGFQGGFAETDGTGAYEIVGLATGTYTVSASPPPGLPLSFAGHGAPVAATAGGVTTGIDIELGESSVITGVVTDHTGDPFAGVAVTAQVGTDGPSFHTSTDETGDYVLSGLPAGELTVEFAPPFGSGHLGECYDDSAVPCGAGATPVTTTAGFVTTDIDAQLSLDPAVTLPGPPRAVTPLAGETSAIVTFTPPLVEGGAGITGYTVTATPGGATCTTEWEWSCEVTGLMPGGTYTFTATASNLLGTGPPSAPSAPITLPSCGPPPAPGPFPDVAGTHAFCTDISWLAASGVTGGFADGTFRPGASITRGSMAAFLYRYEGEPAFTPPATPTFPDVPTDHPFFAEIEWAVEVGLTSGFTDGTFRPANAITRGSMAAFFHRLAGEPPFTPPATPTFPDVPTDHPFFAPIEWLVDVGITGGFGDGTYRPASPVTRGNFAAFLHRYDDFDACRGSEC
jgi:hypothetical protein